MVERSAYEPGTFCWVGLATSDPGTVRGFYTNLFGWQAEEITAGEAGTFTLLRKDGRDVALLYRQQPQARAAGAPPHWTSYISVEDADATAARAAELGGAAVFRAPFEVLGEGRVAAIQDPTSATVSLWQPRSRIGATLVNEVGALCWNELATTDVERAKDFYRELFGWEYETDQRSYVSIVNAGHLNGGIRAHGGQGRRIPPAWLPYFGVENADAASLRAEKLGGRRLLPTAAIRIGRFALIADPQGAQFAVVQSDTDR